MTGIYKITHIDSGKVYIGQAADIERRINAHKNWIINPTRNINRHFYNYAKKYGISGFEFCIIEECCENELDAREMHWFEIYKENCFNVRPSPVSNRGIKRSEEFCIENGERQKKRFESEEYVKKYKAAMKKRSENEKWIADMRRITNDRVSNKEWLEKNQKMTSSKEVNEKRMITNFEKGHSKPVASYDKIGNLIDFYININDAAKSIGSSRSNIVSCLQGRIPTSYGFKWKYLTNEEYLKLNNGEILKIVKT